MFQIKTSNLSQWKNSNYFGRYWLSWVGLIAITFSVIHLYIFAFLLVLVAIGLLLPIKELGLTSRLIFSLLAITCLNCVLGYVAWLLKFRITPLNVSLLYSVSIGLVGLFPLRPHIKASFPPSDKIALVATLAIAIILVRPVIGNYSGSSRLAQISSQNDAVTHYALVEAIVHQGGYLYGVPEAIGNEIAPYSSANPQGWHLNVAILQMLVFKNSSLADFSAHIALFELASVFNYLLLVYLFIYASLQLVDKPSNKLSLYIICLSVGVYVFIDTLLSVFAYGFQPQIYSMSLILAMFTLLSLAKRPHNLTISKLYLAALFTVGLSLGYLFYWPVGLLCLGVPVYDYTSRTQTSLFNKRTVIVSAIVSLGLIQVIVYHFYFLDPNHINAGGGYNSFDLYSTSVFVLATFVLALIRSDWPGQVLAMFLTSSILFAVTIGAYQLKTTQEVSYYFFKSIYLVVLVSYLMVVAFLQKFLATLRVPKPRDQKAINALLLLAAGVFMYSNTFTNGYSLTSVAPLGLQTASVVAEEITTNPRPDDVIFVNCTDFLTSLTATRLVMASTARGNTIQRSFNVVTNVADAEQTAKLVEQLGSKQKLTIVTSRQFARKINTTTMKVVPTIVDQHNGCQNH